MLDFGDPNVEAAVAGCEAKGTNGGAEDVPKVPEAGEEELPVEEEVGRTALHVYLNMIVGMAWVRHRK